MKKISELCEFGDYLEEALCDQLVVGVLSEHIRIKLLAEGELTFKRAVEISKKP